MKKQSTLGGVLIAMMLVIAFSAGCAKHLPLTPSEPATVYNPTAVPTPCVTNCPTAVPTPVTHNWYATVQGASGSTFSFCSGGWDGVTLPGTCPGSASLVSPSFLMIGTTSSVAQTLNFYLYVNNPSATETWSVKIYKDGVLQGTLTLPPGATISQSF